MTLRTAAEPEGTHGHVVLTVSGLNLEPDDITAKLGIRPTSAGRAGELLRNGGREFTPKSGFWTIDTKVENLDQIDPTICQTLELVSSRASDWAKVRSSFETWLTIIIYTYDANVGASVKSETLDLIRRNGLGLDFDFYSLADAADTRRSDNQVA